ncbi:MAG TPA: type II toxin-antitoxin system mRNA interferase toxin, RelE/StbE family [Rugosimonospora sp.]
MAEIVFTDAAIDDLRRIGPDAVPKVLKKILLLEENVEAGYPLGGELTGYRKLVVGRNTWRVVYRVTEAKAVEICEVWAIGPRADAEIYAEAVTRVRATAESRPELASLADVLERLGRAAAGISVPTPVYVEPVPDWLAQRLIHSAGMAREDVAAMDLQAAVDAWTNFVSKPRQEL